MTLEDILFWSFAAILNATLTVILTGGEKYKRFGTGLLIVCIASLILLTVGKVF